MAGSIAAGVPLVTDVGNLGYFGFLTDSLVSQVVNLLEAEVVLVLLPAEFNFHG